MGKRAVESFAVWKPFSLFLRFSQETMTSTGEAPICEQLRGNLQTCILDERHLPESGLLASPRQGLTAAHDEMMMAKGKGFLGKTKNGVCDEKPKLRASP
jgi:hypothetical protein